MQHQGDRPPAYRREFAEADSAERYDLKEYGESSWSSTLWRLEQDVLATWLGSSTFVPRRERYLDFACGTGRVTEFVAAHFTESVGVDISEAMLTRARARVPGTRFVAADVMRDESPVQGTFDLITMFRFVLNADPQDRAGALRWARGLMRDDTSRVVVNNHSNLWTHKALTSAARKLRHPRGGVTGNVLSHRQMTRLAEEAGFTVEDRHGLGHFGGHVQRFVGARRMAALQQWLSGRGVFQWLGEDQIYVLAPRPGAKQR
ncbi:class I SAM-dependent DNA methyltransferase [Angustibacter sp. McL0619]|uniref:class I SAM-dependent DNA methyltransferase n=1 Tax=Angustibacter sp. McL0619 TaxID=3415676 RepID=UPI003CF4EA69